MSQIIPVPSPITAAEFTIIDTNAAATQVILDASKVVVTDSQTNGMISIAAMREAEMADVKTLIVDTHPTAVPSSVNIAAFNTNLLYIQSLKTRKAKLEAQSIELGILLDIAENNAMVDTNSILNNARLIAKTDAGVASVVKTITETYFSKQGTHSLAASYTIVAAGVIGLSVRASKTFTNTGGTVLSVLVVGGNIADAIRVNPFAGFVIPALWTNVVITNLNTTDPGSFDVFIK